MDEQLIFTTHSTCTVANIHSAAQINLKQCVTDYPNGACLVGNKYLFVAQAKKALINVYNISGANKRESVEQRLPLPETVNCLEVVENPIGESLPVFHLPYLLLASTPSGKLYIWELNSGNLLAVKPMAHYQAITKIQSIMNGRYIVTSGADARVMIWQTIDLVTKEEPKPVHILHDHTLSVTDFCVSNAHASHISAKLFTISDDTTLRCYDLNMDLYKEPKLIATFTFPFALKSIALDPADRACYVGGQQGVFALNLYYKMEALKIVNLINSPNNIYACVEATANEKRSELYSLGQISCPKITTKNATKLACSMDGSFLVVGDVSGSCTIMDIYAKQPVKEVHALASQDTMGSVTSIISTVIATGESDSLLTTEKAQTTQKIPNLQKNIYNRQGLHDIFFQVGESRDDLVLPLDDFESYLDQAASEENAFMQLGGVVTGVKVVKQLEEVAPEVVAESSNDQEVTELKQTVQQLTDAYKELREMHEKLFQEHEELLNKSS
ncbi:LAFE_0H03642g1_1 [Lachancea fermentati]|uniref:Pre-rRNA-processing protein IPI3 n=1 Tax=Lachancea fermentati TaxID=4955 RepID=A0A1G4MJD7_LACFM|nr:LAFE_0H03642g1_1 [Lachancea fermentati]